MQGSADVLAALNDLLADELTAINQYMVHAEMCESWGYERLHSHVQKRAVEEMKHAEKLIARILFLEGQPVVSSLKEIHIGSTVEKQIANDLAAERDAIKAYNSAIALAVRAADNGTRELLEGILHDEEEHLDRLEMQQDQIKQMGLQVYLAMQTED